MRVKIEDCETDQVREVKVAFPNLRHLQEFLIETSRQQGAGLFILLKGRGKFIEVWSSDGKKLLERHTRIDK